MHHFNIVPFALGTREGAQWAVHDKHRENLMRGKTLKLIQKTKLWLIAPESTIIKKRATNIYYTKLFSFESSSDMIKRTVPNTGGEKPLFPHGNFQFSWRLKRPAP